MNQKYWEKTKNSKGTGKEPNYTSKPEPSKNQEENSTDKSQVKSLKQNKKYICTKEIKDFWCKL